MSRLIRAALSLILCLTIVLSVTSCALVQRIKDVLTDGEKGEPQQVVVEVPEGYTGGMRHAYPKYNEVHWFETVGEARDAISRLEAHGSSVYKCALMDVPEENYDVKVMIIFNRTYVEPLQEGQNPFDRKAKDVQVYWFLFNEYIPIDELVYMYADDIRMLMTSSLTAEGEKCKIESPELLTVDYGLSGYSLDLPEDTAPPAKYVIYYSGERIFSIDINRPEDILPNEIATNMAKSAFIVGNTNQEVDKSATDIHGNEDCYWFETYDELLTAIETLKSYGSTIEPGYVFDCDGIMFKDAPLDCKYVICFNKKGNPPLREGQNFFERKIENVGINWFAFDRFYPIFDKNDNSQYFFDDSVLTFYGPNKDTVTIEDNALLTIDYGIPEVGLDWPYDSPPGIYRIYYDGEDILDLEFHGLNSFSKYPPPEFALELVKAIKCIS